MMKPDYRAFFIAFLATLITGCSDDNDDDKLQLFTHAAVINAISANWDDSDIELVDLSQGTYTGNLNAMSAQYGTGLSDYALVTYGKHYYRIGRYNNDTITKYSIENPGKRIYQYSTLDEGQDSSNPQQIVFVSETKAYLLRLESNTIWIVNPSASKAKHFKIGEIDLSHYDDGDGAVEMSDGVIVDGKLYVTLQRLSSWSVVAGNAWVAVIDTATDEEITVDGGAEFPGIHLQTNNPLSITYNAAAGLYVQSVGSYGTWPDYIPEYIGGIEKIDTSDYSTTVILDDGDDSSHPYGMISDMAIFSSTTGYFVGYHGWGNNSLHQFNPSTGVVEPGNIASLSGIDIPAIDAGPDDSLWVSLADTGNPRVLLIDSTDNTVMDDISTTYNPNGVAFAKVE